MLNVIKPYTYIKTKIQREKLNGFSLCCLSLYIFFLLLLLQTNNAAFASTHIPTKKAYQGDKTLSGSTKITPHSPDKHLLNAILQGNFSELPGAEQLKNYDSSESHYVAIGLFGHTLRALLSGREQWCNEAYKIADQIAEKEKHDSYTKIFAYASKGIIKSYQGSYISSLFSYLSAYQALKKHIEQNQSVTPEIVELSHSFNAVLKKIPDEYSGILKIAGIKPISTLHAPERNGAGYPELAQTIDAFHTAIIEKKEVSAETELNSATRIILAHQYLKNKEPQRAIDLLTPIDSTRNQLTVQFYLMGQACLNQGLYKKASWYFTKFLLKREDGSYIKAALLREKWIAIIKGGNTVHLSDAIEKKGTAYTFTDRQALKENKITYNPHLLEARILYDGGQFLQALNTLEKADFSNLSELQQTAYYYRKARILQAMGKLTRALKTFKQIEKMPNTGHYYHKKARLEAGKILIEQKQYEKAIEMLQLVSETKSDMYSSSIDQEAEELIEKWK